MSPYKRFIAATKDYFNSIAFLKGLLAGAIFIFAAGALLFLLGLFITSVYEVFVCLGTILLWAGLLLCVIKEDVLTIVITSGVVSVGSFVAWILYLAGSYFFAGVFMFTPLFYFLVFGTIAVVVLIRAERFRQMRAASAVSVGSVSCAKCGNSVPYGAAFCPFCGAQMQFAQPQQQPTAEEPANKCTACGAELPDGAAFCGKCGAKQE